MVALLSKFAELYFEFLETVAVVVGVAVFSWKWWRAGSSVKFESVIEAMLAAILIPSGSAFLIAAFDPADLLPKLHDAHVALELVKKSSASEGRSRSAGAQEPECIDIHEDSEHRRNARCRAQ